MEICIYMMDLYIDLFAQSRCVVDLNAYTLPSSSIVTTNIITCEP
jgi:hypothetical protein